MYMYNVHGTCMFGNLGCLSYMMYIYTVILSVVCDVVTLLYVQIAIETNLNPVFMTAIEMIDDETYIGADGRHLFISQKNRFSVCVCVCVCVFVCVCYVCVCVCVCVCMLRVCTCACHVCVCGFM